MASLYTVILAAGKGTRMKSSTLKVLHDMGGVSMLEHVVRRSEELKSHKTVVVVPKDYTAIQNNLEASKSLAKKVEYAVQLQQLGTGDALKASLKKLPATGAILILSGDMPLIQTQSLKRFLKAHKKSKSKVSVMTGTVDHSSRFGRMLRDQQGELAGIVEYKDATAEERHITEANLGIYIFDIEFVRKFIGKIQNKNNQKEYYLTDLIQLASDKGVKTLGLHLDDSEETLGVNSQADLAKANQIFYERQVQKFMDKGVSCIGSQIFIDTDVKLEAGVHLESPCYLKGSTVIKQETVVETGCTIKSSKIGVSTLLKAHTYIDDSKVGDDCKLGPFAHLRPGTVLHNKAKVGNFVETKKTIVGEGSKINHLSYVGDAKLGKKVNVGAGTITCNYDGFNKFKTVLEDGVFIGSDTQLVAPVKIGKGAFVGAGTTVTKNVKANALVVSRSPQKEIPGWGTKKRNKNS